MDQYINTKDIRDTFERLTDEYAYTGFLSGIYVSKTWIEHIKPADAEPVVHCKDCKYRDPEDKKCDGAFTGKHGLLPMDDNDFCSYGTKIDGEIEE